MSRRGVLGAAALAMTGLLAAAPMTSALGAADGVSTPSAGLAAPQRGIGAVQALGNRIDTVAARHGMTGARLAQLLRSDPTVWVDTSGAPFVKDVVLPKAAAKAPVARGPYPNSKTFALHSLPGAPRKIFLDFDGHTVTGTAWNASGVSAAPQPAFDMDGQPATFNQAEIDVIQSVWQRVAEDYAPFAIDVTTEDPGAAALNRASSTDNNYGTRVLISPGAQAWSVLCGSACGGIAYVGTFDFVGSQNYQPAWVFSQALRNDVKNIAEAATHEAGHNLGLSHDGTSVLGYSTGQRNWAPIMGIGYYEPLVQWSRGEYSDANNGEDDLGVIELNGAPLRADDRGNTAGTAFALGGTLAGNGYITTRDDVDVFSFTRACTATTKLNVRPAAGSPNLDLSVTLRNAAGTVITTADPVSGQTSPDAATGLGATINRSLAAGTYTFSVDGVGADGGLLGYSDYGSLGKYTISLTACP